MVYEADFPPIIFSGGFSSDFARVAISARIDVFIQLPPCQASQVFDPSKSSAVLAPSGPSRDLPVHHLLKPVAHELPHLEAVVLPLFEDVWYLIPGRVP